MTCRICQRLAFYRVNGVGYCEAHKRQASVHASRVMKQHDDERSEAERQWKYRDVQDTKRMSAGTTCRFGIKRRHP